MTLPKHQGGRTHLFWLGLRVVLGLLLSVQQLMAVPIATLILQGGKIVTMDEKNPVAQAIAIRGDRILAVGSNEEIARFKHQTTKIIQLDGKLAIPGFIEGHGHFLSLGESKQKLDLTRAKSWEEVVQIVADATKEIPQGHWIEGRGWHQSKWTKPPKDHVNKYPRHEQLSKASPRHPVLLTHASGHMLISNALGMELAGVNSRTRDPAGGEILRDSQGVPIGVFRETAMDIIDRAFNLGPHHSDGRDSVQLATDECLRNGVTSFQDAGSSFATVDLFKQLADAGKLKVRLWVMLRESNGSLARRMANYRLIGYGNHHLTVRAIKRMMDGALGTHGAWLFEPYDDLTSSRGHNMLSVSALRQTADLAVQHDFQLCVHAIGDRANHETLNVFQQAMKAHGKGGDLRWRIEHAQHLHPDDVPRFKKLGVIASMQAIHATSDAPFVVQRLGMRRAKEGAYVWKSLLDSGAKIVNGTDTPVERVSPIECFYASVTRKLTTGVAFFPEQRMTREQALRSYTKDAAYAAFEDNLKGMLAPGKLADIVVLSKDLMTVPADKILETKVLTTIIGGVVVYKREL